MEEPPTSKTLGYYFFILGGHVTSLFGSTVLSFIITLSILTTTSSFVYSLVVFWTFLPYLIILPFAGVFSDILNRKIILIATNIIRISTTLVLIFLFAFGTLTLNVLFLLSLLRSVSDAFYQPTYFTIVPSMVNKKQLGRINGLTYFLTIIPQTFAPYYGSLLFNDFSLFLSLLVMIPVIGITLIPLILIKIPQTREIYASNEKNKEEAVVVKYFRSFLGGFRTFKLFPGIIVLIGAVLILEFFSGAFSIFIIIFIHDFHGGPFTILSLFYLLSFLGAIIGINIFVIRKYWNPVLIVFFLSISLSFLTDILFLLAPYQAFVLMFFARTFKSFLLVFIYSILTTIMQSNVPNNRIGRVGAIYFTVSSFVSFWAPYPIGILWVYSPDIRLTFTVLAIIGIICALNFYIILKIMNRRYSNYITRGNAQDNGNILR